METILFDLDGTLLPIDMEIFESAYVRDLSMHLKDVMAPELLIKYLYMSTKTMILDLRDHLSNEAKFYEAFEAVSGLKLQDFDEKLMEYYTNHYQNIAQYVETGHLDTIQEIVNVFKEKGYQLVIATNPMIPWVATKQRIEWTGLNQNDFQLITTFENSTYCKPTLNYYNEVLDKLNTSATKCMLIGNDYIDDLSVQNLGMKTFLVTNFACNSDHEQRIEPHYEGTYLDLLAFAKALNSVGE